MEEEQTHDVVLALGSNCEQVASLSAARTGLTMIMAVERESHWIWTEPIGPSPDRYLNMMVRGRTPLGRDELGEAIRALERSCGRERGCEAGGEVKADIDIMAFDGQRERPADWERGYIKELYKEI